MDVKFQCFQKWGVDVAGFIMIVCSEHYVHIFGWVTFMYNRNFLMLTKECHVPPFLALRLDSSSGPRRLILEVPRSRSDTPHSVGLPWTNDHNIRKRQTSMPPAEFEPAVLASERPQTHALHRATTRVFKYHVAILITNVCTQYHLPQYGLA